MNVTIHPHTLSGTIEIPSSKSYAHRMLIAAALADKPTEVHLNVLSDDISATSDCLRTLGAGIHRTKTGFFIEPIHSKTVDACTLFCRESGSTLRFLLPVAAALGISCTFTGIGRLSERPNAVLTKALNAHGVHADSDLLPISITGKLDGGVFEIPGNISSQYITGLLFALPLCGADSEIILTTPLESASYIDITLKTLARFGIRIDLTETGWRIPGKQTYRSPGLVSVEGDWSAAAFWLAANTLGSDIECCNLNHTSLQGDRAIIAALGNLGKTIDVSNTPDLAPVLAVAAALHAGTTHITGAARLRIKESDRLRAVGDMLKNFGCSVDELDDSLIVHGGRPLKGCTVDGCRDHRIVMAAAIAATIAEGPVTITDAQAVSKSYPSFFEHFNQLGGLAYVESDR